MYHWIKVLVFRLAYWRRIKFIYHKVFKVVFTYLTLVKHSIHLKQCQLTVRPYLSRHGLIPKRRLSRP